VSWLVITGAAGGPLTFTVTDPAGTLIAPIGVTVIDAAGTPSARSVTPGAPLTVAVPAGGYLAVDEAEVHPYMPVSFVVPQYDALVAAERPTSAAAIAAFGMRSAAVQELVLDDGALPSTAAADVTALYDALDSTSAQRSLLFDACGALADLAPAERTALEQALVPLVRAPSIQLFNTTWSRCGTAVPAAELAGELAQLATTVTPATAGRLDYLLAFDYAPATALATMSKIATDAPTLALRDRAIQRLSFQATGRYTDVPAADIPAWQTFFRGRLSGVTSQNRLLNIWRAEVALGDVAALPLVAPLLHSVALAPEAQRQIVCDAFGLASASPDAFETFRQAAQPWESLSAEAQTVLADPSTCNAARRAATSARRTKPL
jgi:hypothetical protein